MQQLTEWPRDGFTDEQIVGLLQDSPALELTAGLELVDLDLNVLEDVSDDLAGGQVSRNSLADLHATCTLQITRDLDWGAGLVRPYLTVSDGQIAARFYLGVYHLNTPSRSAQESPPTFDVQGYDLLLRLADPVGDAWSIAVGDLYLTKVEEILRSLGFTQFIIDQEAAAKAAPTPRTWAFTDRVTWLQVVNDLLASVGYAGIWSDWNGRLRCSPYQLPAAREIEWTYTDDAATTMLTAEQTITQDFFDAPNKWIFYRGNGIDGETPTEGNGRFGWVNYRVGLTSVEARGGRIITRMESVDAADQAALYAQALQMIQNDMDVATVIDQPTSANPLHWHLDRLLIQGAGSIVDVQCTAWTLPLPGGSGVPGDMSQTWRAISQ